jgi:hypothetical protein
VNLSLETALIAAGWKSGTHRGFRATSRAGIEFEVGEVRGEEGRLALRYRYHTASTNAEGEVALPADSSLARVQDAMTEIYLRIHEKPDPTRVFGGGKSQRRPVTSTTLTPLSPALDSHPTPEGQESLDL